MADGGQTFVDQGDGLVVNAGTGAPVLRVMGPVLWAEPTRWSWAFAELPGQCLLRFAVQRARHDVHGDLTMSGHAVMTGTDQSGADVLWFRMGRAGGVEVVASPDWQLTPQAVILICVVAPWLERHYYSP